MGPQGRSGTPTPTLPLTSAIETLAGHSQLSALYQNRTIIRNEFELSVRLTGLGFGKACAHRRSHKYYHGSKRGELTRLGREDRRSPCLVGPLSVLRKTDL